MQHHIWSFSAVTRRRLEASERPLQMVYDYLAAMGYEDPARVQQEAANSDLSCLIRFYSGELGGTSGAAAAGGCLVWFRVNRCSC